MGKYKFINPEFLTPHYSTKLCRGYYNYLSDHYSRDMFYEICDELEVPPEFLLEDNNWFSHTFYLEFLKKIKGKTGSEYIAEKVGQSLLSSENINPFEIALLKITSPFIFFLNIPFAASKLNRRSKYRLMKFRPGKVTIQIDSPPDALHDIDTCRNAEGSFKSPKDFYGLDSLEVDHSNCIHRGSKDCIFNITYSAKTYNLKRAAITMLIAVGGLLIFSSFEKVAPSNELLSRLALGLYLSVVSAAYIIAKSIGVLKHHSLFYQQSKVKEQVLFESKLKLDRRYNEANLLRDLSLRLVTLTAPKTVIESCVTDLEKRFGYERILVMLLDSSRTKLLTADVRGFAEHSEMLFNLSFPFPSSKGESQLFANILENGDCTLIDDISDYKKKLEPQNQLLLTAFGVKSLIVSPIQDSNNKYGILAIGSVGADRQLSTDDKHLVENISRMLALFFQNARSFEKERTLKLMFQKYVPQVVMDGIRHLESDKSGSLAPKNNAVTSLFVDLRSFTSLSESLPPERVVEMLNLYIEYVTEIIAREGGIIDNLVGDGIVAFFPADEIDRTEHAQKALRCGVQILANLDTLNSHLKEKGYPSAKLGIGMHSGNATVGNLGSDKKMNYTAIGDTVNLAARLESLCKEYSHLTPSAQDGLILMSESVFMRAKLDVPTKEIGNIQVRGRIDSVRVLMIDKEMAISIDTTNVKLLTSDEIRTRLKIVNAVESDKRRRPNNKSKDKKIA